jgi:hypothetical protein
MQAEVGANTAAAPPGGAFAEEERMMGLEPTTFCMASRRSSQLSYIRESRQYSQAYAESRASFTS